MIEPSVDGLAHAGAVIVRPAPDFRVGLADQQALREGLAALHDPPKLRQMLFNVGLGGFDQGVESRALAARAFP